MTVVLVRVGINRKQILALASLLAGAVVFVRGSSRDSLRLINGGLCSIHLASHAIMGARGALVYALQFTVKDPIEQMGLVGSSMGSRANASGRLLLEI